MIHGLVTVKLAWKSMARMVRKRARPRRCIRPSDVRRSCAAQHRPAPRRPAPPVSYADQSQSQSEGEGEDEGE
jgi:hypothetical protein